MARGVIAACTVLVPRVLVVSAFLDASVGMALAPLLLPQFLVGLALALFAWRRDIAAAVGSPSDNESPLRLANALQMALAFQVALTIIRVVQSRFGATELYAMAALLGLTDVDALTVSMSSPASLLAARVAARAIAIGILTNTLLKLSLSVVIGRASFRRATAIGLLAMAVTSAITLAVTW